MSFEFRQRTPGDYVKIASKRKWLIILPAIAIATAVRKLLLTTAVAAMFLAIPAMALILKLTQLFELFTV